MDKNLSKIGNNWTNDQKGDEVGVEDTEPLSERGGNVVDRFPNQKKVMTDD